MIGAKEYIWGSKVSLSEKERKKIQSRPHYNSENLRSDFKTNMNKAYVNEPVSNFKMHFRQRQYWTLFINNYELIAQ